MWTNLSCHNLLHQKEHGESVYCSSSIKDIYELLVQNFEIIPCMSTTMPCLQLPEDVSDMGTVGPTLTTAAVKVGSDVAVGAAV